MKLTVEMLHEAIDTVDGYANLLRIPGTSIDDKFRAGWSVLHDAIVVNRDLTVSELVVQFLNWTPLFGSAMDSQAYFKNNDVSAEEAATLEPCIEFLTECRAIGNYQFH